MKAVHSDNEVHQRERKMSKKKRVDDVDLFLDGEPVLREEKRQLTIKALKKTVVPFLLGYGGDLWNASVAVDTKTEQCLLRVEGLLWEELMLAPTP